MNPTQGDVWWGPAPHKSSPAYRPWLVVSDGLHPFSNVECIVVGMTTQEHPKGIPVRDDAWVRGGSKKDAYISPWYATTMKHRDLDTQQGKLANPILTNAIESLHSYTPPPTS